MTPGSRHTTAKSTQRLLLARRVNFLVILYTISKTYTWNTDDPVNAANERWSAYPGSVLLWKKAFRTDKMVKSIKNTSFNFTWKGIEQSTDAIVTLSYTLNYTLVSNKTHLKLFPGELILPNYSNNTSPCYIPWSTEPVKLIMPHGFIRRYTCSEGSKVHGDGKFLSITAALVGNKN